MWLARVSYRPIAAREATPDAGTSRHRRRDLGSPMPHARPTRRDFGATRPVR